MPAADGTAERPDVHTATQVGSQDECVGAGRREPRPVRQPHRRHRARQRLHQTRHPRTAALHNDTARKGDVWKGGISQCHRARRCCTATERQRDTAGTGGIHTPHTALPGTEHRTGLQRIRVETAKIHRPRTDKGMGKGTYGVLQRPGINRPQDSNDTSTQRSLYH